MLRRWLVAALIAFLLFHRRRETFGTFLFAKPRNLLVLVSPSLFPPAATPPPLSQNIVMAGPAYTKPTTAVPSHLRSPPSSVLQLADIDNAPPLPSPRFPPPPAATPPPAAATSVPKRNNPTTSKRPSRQREKTRQMYLYIYLGRERYIRAQGGYRWIFYSFPRSRLILDDVAFLFLALTRDHEAAFYGGPDGSSPTNRTFVLPPLATPEHGLERGAPQGFRDRHVGDECEVRGQHRTLAVESFGETGRDDLEGGTGCGGGVALQMRQADNHGVAAVPRSAAVEGLHLFR